MSLISETRYLSYEAISVVTKIGLANECGSKTTLKLIEYLICNSVQLI